MSRICIDGYNIALPRGTGIATYGRGLLEANRARGADCEILFGPAAPRSSSSVVNEAALIEPQKPPQRLKRAQRLKRTFETFSSQFGRSAWPVSATHKVNWPNNVAPPVDRFWSAPHLFHRANRCFKRHRKLTPLSFEQSAPAPSIMHWTVPLPIWARHVPNVYTVHDLIPLKAPHTTMNDREEYLSLHRQILDRADHIAVISHQTKEDLISLFNIDEDRITITYQAVHAPEDVTLPSELAIAAELYNTFDLNWKEYFIHFGAIEPKKNLGRIVEAYLAAGCQTPLVVVGSRGWLEEDETALLNQVRRIGGQGASRVHLYEYMSRRMLLNLIRGAKATLFPSIYEGFGLPILESMALNTPVLTSKGGATGEVAGDAAVLVAPYDIDSLAAGIRALDADADLRNELSLRGKDRARIFSPEAYEARLDTLYSRVT